MSFPKVSIDIVSSTTTSMEHNKQEFWTEISKRMLKENPLIYQLLAVTERIDTKSEQFLEGYKRGACLIYALLSCQAEADEKNRRKYNQKLNVRAEVPILFTKNM